MHSPDIRPGLHQRLTRIASVGLAAAGPTVAVISSGCVPVEGDLPSQQPSLEHHYDALSSEIAAKLSNIKPQLEQEFGGPVTTDSQRLPKPQIIKPLSQEDGIPHISPLAQPNAFYLTEEPKEAVRVTHLLHLKSPIREQTWAVGQSTLGNPAYYLMESATIHPATGTKRKEFHAIFEGDTIILEGNVVINSGATIHMPAPTKQDGTLLLNRPLEVSNPEIILAAPVESHTKTNTVLAFFLDTETGQVRVYTVLDLPQRKFLKQQAEHLIKTTPNEQDFRTSDGRVLSSNAHFLPDPNGFPSNGK